MKKLKLTKLVASSLLVALVLALNPIGASAEWKQDCDGWWYSQENSYATKWKQIDGVWYYFDDNGYMKKGWLLDNTSWYYLDSTGVMQTGIIQVDGKTYYLAASGEMKPGNVTIDGETYSFAKSGEATGDKIPQAAKAFSGEGITTTPVQIKNTLKSSEKVVEIKIEGNPGSTGYQWEYHINTDGIIKEDSNDFQLENTDPEVCGSPGIYTWKFSGLKEGTTEIIFVYRRSWEKEPIETKTYICTVDKDLNITVKEK